MSVSLGQQMRNIRKNCHMTQRELAELSGVHFNTIINFENGKRFPSTETASILFGAMGYELIIAEKTGKR